jgi:O-acetyl-ADP-ribose deacetylase
VIKVIKGDITKVPADAIVNAANSSLMGGGGGVDGAIHRVGGRRILSDCEAIIAKRGPCQTGDAVITSAGNLPATFVIHTVGPIWRGGFENEPLLLANCYRNTLHLALENNCFSIAFPGISTGVYGYPKDKAAEIAVRVTCEFLAGTKATMEIILVCFDDEYFNLIQGQLKIYQD